MKLPIQAPPVSRSINAERFTQGIVPQSCFGDCMVDKLGVPQCIRAFESGNVGDIISCITSVAGTVISPTTVAADLGVCGLKCIF